MEKNNSGQELFNKIKEEHISPKPRWIFCAKNYFLWVAGVFFILLAGISISIIFYNFQYNDWNIYQQATDGWWDSILLFLPVFWLVLSGSAVLLALYDLRYTKKGYKYPLGLTSGAVLLLGLSLGAVFFYGGVGRAVDDILGKKAPYYSKVINPRVDFWCQPEQGRLAGIIASIIDKENFVLRGCEGKDWSVRVKEIRVYPEPVHLRMESGVSVRALGRKISETEFMAEKILPMHTGEKFFLRHKKLHQETSECLNCAHSGR
jgi:hypothetical protein